MISAMKEMTKLDLMKRVWLYEQHSFFRWCSRKLRLKKRKKKSMYNEQSLIAINSILGPTGADTIADITELNLQAGHDLRMLGMTLLLFQ